MKKEFRAIAHGRVQMVNYRHFALTQARKLNIVGTITNRPNGSVEIVAEGEEADLEKYIDKLSRGPFFAHVSNLEVMWAEQPNGRFESFTILDDAETGLN